MFCRVGVEAVFSQRLFALSQCEPAGRNDRVIIAAHRADRAVTNLHIEWLCQLNREAHRPAMTAAFMRVQLCGHVVQFDALSRRSQCFMGDEVRV